MINPSGKVFYKDEYNTIYRIEWATVGAVVDFTIITMQPYVWGQPNQGYVNNGILFRLGIVTVQRQVLRIFDGGYEVIAEGSSQYQDYIQTNFPCETGPIDTFKYHLNNIITDDIEFKVVDGPHWADPDDPDDTDVVWGDVESDGTAIDITSTGFTDILTWIDVW